MTAFILTLMMSRTRPLVIVIICWDCIVDDDFRGRLLICVFWCVLGSSRSHRRNKRGVLTNDELFYDPEEDDRDQAWVDARRKEWVFLCVQESFFKCQIYAGGYPEQNVREWFQQHLAEAFISIKRIGHLKLKFCPLLLIHVSNLIHF